MPNKSIFGLIVAIRVLRLRLRALNAFVLICALSLLFLTGKVLAAALQDERSVRDQCSGNSLSQADMRECLEKKARDSEVSLKRAEARVLSAITRWDEDAKYITEAKAKLKTSGQEFMKYRNAHCAFMASLSGGGVGNSHEIRRLACVFELNTRRAKQLKSAIADLPTK